MSKATIITLSLANIVQAVADGFPNFKPEVSFANVAQKSLGKTPHIVSFKVDRKEGNVIIVTEKPRPYGGVAMSPISHYNVVRFFPLGNKWEVSFDIQDGEADKVFDCLLGTEYDEGKYEK